MEDSGPVGEAWILEGPLTVDEGKLGMSTSSLLAGRPQPPPFLEVFFLPGRSSLSWSFRASITKCCKLSYL